MSRIPLLVIAFLAALVGACSPSNNNDGCGTNADCPAGRFCAVSGDCVECRETADCGDAQFCCQGVCYDEGEQEAHCGCAAARGSAGASSALAGDTCGEDASVCLVGGARATVANVDEGVCGCTCDAAAGGTLCGVDDEGALTCSCSRSDPEGTCERPALDAEGNPHIVADTCTPQQQCVCFGEATQSSCDPSGDAPDCTAAGCVNALGDVDNCGVAGRVCTDDATGIADTGTCHDGGCSCNQNTDCQGSGLNVDLCAFVGDVSQCVCDDYEVDGEKGACPLGLLCGAGGCMFDGTAYGTREALLEALGVTGG